MIVSTWDQLANRNQISQYQISTPYEPSGVLDTRIEENGLLGNKVSNFSELTIGNNDQIIGLSGINSSWRLWIGKKLPQNAPFRVDPNGNVIATSITISGYVAIGGAAADVNAGVTTISGGKITANTITATQIAASTITSDKISVTTLDAISVNMGTLTAGTINGGYITTGGVSIVGNGLVMNNNKLIAFKDTGGSLSASINMDNSNLFYVLNTNGATKFGSTSNNIVELIANNAVVFQGDTSGKAHVNDPLYVGGVSKSAIVPTTEGHKALYCVEAPDVWFFDFSKDQESIDPLFLEVTEGEMKTIKTEEGELLVFRKRKGFADKRFEDKTDLQFVSNNEFWSKPEEIARQSDFALSRKETDGLQSSIEKSHNLVKQIQIIGNKKEVLK